MLGGLCWLTAACAGPAQQQPHCTVAGRTHMHAHNDYNRARPLFEALEQGASSVEADVFLSDGVLLVGHDRSQLSAARSLDALYLRPLFDVWQRQGRVVPSTCAAELLLLIDVKADPEACYAALKLLLDRYRSMLTHVRAGKLYGGAVRVVISGERPKHIMAAEPELLAGYDGRVLEHDAGVSSAVMPLVSEQWSKLFSWTGEGLLPVGERNRLRATVAEAHAQGRVVRFWATPESASVWLELLSAGVDYINTDSLYELRKFLREHQHATSP
jgi:glycerophosphoryl diester phosphodiesterase